MGVSRENFFESAVIREKCNESYALLDHNETQEDGK